MGVHLTGIVAGVVEEGGGLGRGTLGQREGDRGGVVTDRAVRRLEDEALGRALQPVGLGLVQSLLDAQDLRPVRADRDPELLRGIPGIFFPQIRKVRLHLLELEAQAGRAEPESFNPVASEAALKNPGADLAPALLPQVLEEIRGCGGFSKAGLGMAGDCKSKQERKEERYFLHDESPWRDYPRPARVDLERMRRSVTSRSGYSNYARAILTGSLQLLLRRGNRGEAHSAALTAPTG